MIEASRMNWAALTSSRCASRSTSVQSVSAKRTVVARIGIAGPYHRMRFRYRLGEKATPRKRNPQNATAWVDLRQDMTSAPTFETIYAEHSAEVHRAAYAILRDATLAEDVVQEVFERVWRGSGHDHGAARSART